MTSYVWLTIFMLRRLLDTLLRYHECEGCGQGKATLGLLCVYCYLDYQLSPAGRRSAATTLAPGRER